MGEKIVVGAGLAGLTAAINLRRRGHEVRVLERRDGVGGPARDMGTGELTYVMADGSPMELEELRRYTGIDIAPACEPLPSIRVHSYGKRYDVTFPANVPAFLVERGPRDTSLDRALYRIAVEEGVSFEFNHPLKTRGDFADLPPGTILATGFFPDTYRILDIPYLPAYALAGQGPSAECMQVDYKGPQVIIFMDSHTWDYAFFSTINGWAGALLFQRKRPLSGEAKRWFPQKLAEVEGITFPAWYEVDLAVLPMASFSNPRLFHGKFILAGTLAGVQDPFFLFGVHGALASGAVAALAVEKPDEARREFSRINRFWKANYLFRRLMEVTHPWGMFAVSRLSLELYPYYSPLLLRYAFLIVPGWLRLGTRKV